MSLDMLAYISEQIGWCGTKPPGSPPFGPGAHDSRGDPRQWRLGPGPQPWGPHPEPWLPASVQIGLYGAIALHQTGGLVSGTAAQSFAAAARALFDETCSTYALSELIRWLLDHPPRPHPQWLSELAFAGQTLAFAQATKQEALAAAASVRIADRLREFGLDTQDAADAR